MVRRLRTREESWPETRVDGAQKMALERSRTFADLLREYRRAAQMTQEKLAERAGLSVRALRKLESGTSLAPRRDTIDLLASALKLAPEKRTLLEASASRQRFLLQHRRSTASGPPVGGPGGTFLRAGAAGEAPCREGTTAAGAGRRAGYRQDPAAPRGAERGRAQGWTVLQGGCQRRSGQEPYAPLLTALDRSLPSRSAAQLQPELEGCAWLVRLLPELAETSLVPVPQWQLPPEQERRLMFAAVGRYLANLAGPSGTLLVLDDLQWAGQDALDLLAALLRAPTSQTGRHLRVVAAYRSTEVRPADPLGMLLADLAREELATPGRARPSGARGRGRALDCALGRSARGDRDELQKRLVKRTDGVPYFLVSWAQAVQSEVYAEVPENGETGGETVRWPAALDGGPEHSPADGTAA